MKNLKEYWLILTILTILLVSTFYWFEWRPSQIAKICNQEAVQKAKEINDFDNAISTYDANYESCLHENGLAK